MTQTLTVLFVRHGESEANRQNLLVSDRGDPALTEKGHEEVQQLARLWRQKPVTAVYSSPLRRAQQTAFAFTSSSGPDVILDDRLHEIHLGAFDGKNIADLEQHDATRYHRWKSDPESPPPGGERLSAVGERMHHFLTDMAARHPSGFVIAATHADCLKAVVLWILHAPWQSAQFLHFDNVAGVYVIKASDEFNLLGLPPMPPAS